MFSGKSKTNKKQKRVGPSPVPTSSTVAQKSAAPSRPTQPASDATADAKDRPSGKNSSALNPHLQFDGNLRFSGTVLIDCDFRGTIVTDDTLVIGATGNVHAELTAGVVEISGTIHGNVRARTSVKIFSGGAVHGNIETPTISMEEGVVFEGACTRPGKAQPQGPQGLDVLRPAAETVPGRPAADAETGRKRMIVSASELADLK